MAEEDAISFPISYACGTEYSHRSRLVLSGQASGESILDLMDFLHGELCPPCLSEERALGAAKQVDEMGVKPLIGMLEHCRLAEIVRAHMCTIWLAEKVSLDPSTLAYMLNRAQNRQALLWLNYRDAPYHRQQRGRLYRALCANHQQTAKEGEHDDFP